ncbi:MAG: caspase family protein [Nitrospirales bacterium]
MAISPKFSKKTIVTALFFTVLSTSLLSSCRTNSGQDSRSEGGNQGGASSAPVVGGDDFVTVDCLLPGQMRRLGTHVTFVTARRPTRTTAEDCAIRGGEFTLADRADYQTSLKLWLDAGQEGDAKAQYYVGTLYEKGPKGIPDFALAAAWYQKAAEQGHRQAAMNLGRLYEKGLGVPQNASTAFKWYGQASGFGESGLSMLMNGEASSRIQGLERAVGEKEQEIHRLRTHINEITHELSELRSQLGQQTSEAESEHQKLHELEKNYEEIQAQAKAEQAQHERDKAELQKLKSLLTKKAGAVESMHQRIQELETSLIQPKQDGRHEQLQKEMQAIQVKLDHQMKVVSERNQDVQRLHQHIASLEKEAAERSRELEQTPSVDLGFEGPTIEIIDPPMTLTRGINVVSDAPSIPAVVGVPRHLAGRVIAPAGLRTFRINGHAVRVDEQGMFAMDFPPIQEAHGTFPVQIMAVDIQNKHAAKKITLVAGKTVVKLPEMSDEDMDVFGDYYALVIGNDKYEHWNPLHNAISDAQAVADILQSRYGFNVTFLKDATRRDILKGLNNFRKSLKENDNLLVYYAGHGHLEKDIDRGYWIPIDAEIDDTSQWILTPSITDLLELMSAKHILVVADSCFAGKLTRSSLAQLRPGLSEENRMKMLKTVAKKRVRTALTSGGEHPVLDVGEGGHSVFTGALISVLGENQTILETERLFLAIRTRVVSAASEYKMEQIPTYWPIQFAGHESLGDFIFIPQQS